MTVQITQTLTVKDRAEWRAWLVHHHATAHEIWLISYGKTSAHPSLPYLESVEEALCFGWIDGIAKRIDHERMAQRFTPRRPKSHWTELNKERARRLIVSNQMTDAGLAQLPDLALEAFRIAPDILAALQEDPQTWAYFQNFPPVYQRIRIGYIEEMRQQPEVFRKRLAYFLKNTQKNKMFGTMA